MSYLNLLVDGLNRILVLPAFRQWHRWTVRAAHINRRRGIGLGFSALFLVFESNDLTKLL